jgi:hypothetical protein
MIAFASLFLGLMVGARPVTVIVGDAVAAVAFELDGRAVGRLEGAPWTLTIDFGTEFEPHELIARAFDAKGEEAGLARQWINLPRAPAEVEIVLERDASGRAATARLAWESILGVRPNRVVVTFDGRALPLAEKRVTLPAYDPQATHVLTAVLDYPNGVRSRSDVVMGGGSAGDARSELTAVPILVPGGKPPRPEALEKRFWRGDQPLSVAAVEHGPAEVVLVRDLSSDEAAQAMQRGRSLGSAFPFLGDRTSLAREDQIRILWPVARRIVNAGTSNELFETSREFSGKSASFRFLLTQVDYPGDGAALPRRLADAVAVAGLRACGSYARRAVVLVVGSAATDRSRYAAGPVRRYLERLHVPLSVWSLAPPGAASAAAAAWGEPQDISTLPGLVLAVEKLRKELERQSVVWLAGRYLPQDIALRDAGDGIALVR